ncbi:MAG: hypothetical protein WC149_08665 [Arcobacteraceae bacterium]
MTKTEEVLKLISEDKTNEEIKAETNASDSLISRCRTRIKLQNENKDEENDDNPTDEEIDNLVKIKLKAPKKVLTNNQKTDEDYKCMGCNHEWTAKVKPKFCPNCGCGF